MSGRAASGVLGRNISPTPSPFVSNVGASPNRFFALFPVPYDCANKVSLVTKSLEIVPIGEVMVFGFPNIVEELCDFRVHLGARQP